ncbi:MAG: hypothetical protein WCQ20_02205 [Synechococcaceae cyanobacterium ELA739]|jgi:hypothetical protein
MASRDAEVRLDLNNPVFQEQLLSLQKNERHAALDTLSRSSPPAWRRTASPG